MAKIDLTGKIDPDLTRLLAASASASKACEVPIFVVGATARDLILEKYFGFKPVTATRDLDLGVRVDGMERFDRFRAALLAGGRFTETSSVYCLKFDRAIPLDLLPFGEIETARHRVEFPPPQRTSMNALGFADAFACSTVATVAEGVDIRVASVAGLAMLKIISWGDRPAERKNDAEDLGMILEKYLDAGNVDRLFDEHPLLISDDFDAVAAGATLLGLDIVKLASPETIARIRELIAREAALSDGQGMAQAMLPGFARLNEERALRFHRLLRSLLKGLLAGQ